MLYLIELLGAIRIPAATIAALESLLTRYGGGFLLRSPATAALLKRWAVRILATYEVGSEGLHWLTDSVKTYLSKIFGEVVDSLDIDSLLHAGGRAFAKTLNKKLIEKYGIECPIVDFASDTIAEEVGEWFADLLNEQIQLKTNSEAIVFSTLFPIDNVVPELDAFMVEELSIKLDINVTSVLQNPTLLVDIKTQIFEKLTEEFYTAVNQVKLQAMNNIKAEFASSNIKAYKEAILAVDAAMPLLTDYIQANLVKRIPILSKVKFTPNLKKINNKLRQREYRRTHTEVRHWEVKT